MNLQAERVRFAIRNPVKAIRKETNILYKTTHYTVVRRERFDDVGREEYK